MDNIRERDIAHDMEEKKSYYILIMSRKMKKKYIIRLMIHRIENSKKCNYNRRVI